MDGGDFDPSTTRIKSKKRVRNAFFFFMQDLKAQWIRDRKLAPNTTMAEMSGIAGPVWKVKHNLSKCLKVLEGKYRVGVGGCTLGWVGGACRGREFPACFLAHPDCKSSILYVV